MKALVVYYSLSGTARTVANAIAKELSADIEAIQCDRYRPGPAGFMRAAFDSWAGRLPPIARPKHVPSAHDLIVVGGPMWAFHAATPVRAYLQTYLRKEAVKLSRVAFFLTHGGSPADKAFREMEALAGLAPKGTLVVRQVDVEAGRIGPAVSSFAAALRQSKAA
jgi:hypothetical protein